MKALIYYRWHGPSQKLREVLEEMPERVPWSDSAWILLEIGERNYEAALERLSRHGQPFINDVPTGVYECNCYTYMGDARAAQEACEATSVFLENAVAERPNDPRLHAWLAETYAKLERKEDAIREAERTVELGSAPNPYGVGPGALEILTRVYAWVGEPDQALDRIEFLLSNTSGLTVAILRKHPGWDPLREHPRFQQILEKYGERQ
jgi:tetratricopeptide (TPR) repeat protein